MSPEAAVQPEILHLSLVVGGALRDSDGERLGSVDDLIVRLGGTGYPPITGFLVSVAGRQAYLPAEMVSAIDQGGGTPPKAKLGPRPFGGPPEKGPLEKDRPGPPPIHAHRAPPGRADR